MTFEKFDMKRKQYLEVFPFMTELVSKQFTNYPVDLEWELMTNEIKVNLVSTSSMYSYLWNVQWFLLVKFSSNYVNYEKCLQETINNFYSRTSTNKYFYRLVYAQGKLNSMIAIKLLRIKFINVMILTHLKTRK